MTCLPLEKQPGSPVVDILYRRASIHVADVGQVVKALGRGGLVLRIAWGRWIIQGLTKE